MSRRSLLLGSTLLIHAILHAQFGPPVEVVRDEVFYFDGWVDKNSIAIADIDGDGLDDIIGVAPYGPLWYRHLGNGEYGPGQLVAEVTVASSDVKVADLNGNGFPDIVVALENGSVRVYINQNGTFDGTSVQAGQWNDTPLNVFPDDHRIELADMNGDGHLDVLIAHHWTLGIWCYDNDGNGNFGPKRVLLENIQGVVSFLVADIDQDGQMDVAYILDNVNADRVIWHRNLANGTGNVGPPMIMSSLQNNPRLLRVADIDGDGDLDLIHVTSTGELMMILQEEGLQFAAPVPFLSDQGLHVTAFEIRDFNGDGQLDLVLGNAAEYWINVHPGQVGGGFGAPYTVTDTDPGPRKFRIHDLNGDGTLDILCSSSERQLTAYYQGSSWSWSPIAARTPDVKVRTVDIDQDGLPDIVGFYPGGSGGLVWFRNTGSGFSKGRIIARGLTSISGIAPGDIDGDGWPDIVYFSVLDHRFAWVRNQGDGTWSEPQTIWNPFYAAQALEVADMNGDGVDDIIASNTTNVTVITLNNGEFSFHAVSGATGFYTVADMDGNGLKDVVRWGANSMIWYRNNGGLTFTEMPAVSLQGLNAAPHVADLDNDGLLDLSYINSGGTHWRRNLGGGGFANIMLLSPVTMSINGSSDVDGDMLVDLLVRTFEGFRYLKNLGNGGFSPEAIPIPVEGTVHSLHLVPADLTMNGYDDLIFKRDLGEIGQLAYLGHHGQTGMTGRCFVDNDGDGLFSTGDTPVPWAPVVVQPGTYIPMSNAMGTYRYQGEPGTYQVGFPAGFGDGLWQVTTGSSGHTVEVMDQMTVTDIDFAIVPAVDSSLVEPGLALGMAPCGAQNLFWISLRNKGTRVEQGTITLDLHPLYGFVSSDTAPVSVNGNTIEWAFAGLDLFEVRNMLVQLVMPGSMAIGSLLPSTVTINTLDAQQQATGTFSSTLEHFITCAYDPNDKQVEPVGYGDHGALSIDTDELEYTIRFQNTGTAPAFHVEIRDPFVATLDPTRLEIVAYSHVPTSVHVEDDQMVVRFEWIMLPDSGYSQQESQGFIRFRIGTEDGLPHLTTIENQAGIYFDLEPPVITNLTSNLLVDCSTWEPVLSLEDTDVLLADEGDAHLWYLNGELLPDAVSSVLVAEQLGSYHAVVTSVHGCVASTNAVQIFTVGLMEIDAPVTLVIPNPLKDMTRIVHSGPLTSEHRIQLIDAHGRILRSEQGGGSNEYLLHRQDLASGMYMLRITKEGVEVASVRIIAE